MHRTIAFSLALFLCSPIVQAAPALRLEHAPYQSIHAQRMASLAPSLRQWVVEEGRRSADASPTVEVVAQSVRTRLSGQDFSSADVEALVQMVMMEAARQAEADLRSTLEEMKAINERKKAQREAARAAGQARQGQKPALRASYGQRTQLQPAKTAQVQTGDKDSLSELNEQEQLRMQMVMDRMTKADSAASNAMKKFGETASQIISNLK